MKKIIMRKVGTYIMISSMIFGLVGCGNKEIQEEVIEDEYEDYEEDNFDDDYQNGYENSNNNEEADLEDEYDAMEENAESESVITDSISFDGDVIVTPECVLYLKSDGTIWGMGVNEEGQLGNGQRTDSSTWTQVEGIYDAIKICRTGNHFYALTLEGKLYHWGSNIFSPEEMTIFSKVTDISNSAYENVRNNMIVTCEDGNRYVEMTADYFDEHFVPLDFDDAQDIRVSPDYTILIDGSLYNYDKKKDVELTYIDDVICEQSFQMAYTLKEIPCDEKLSGGYCNFSSNGHSSYFVGQDTGSIYEWEDNDRNEGLNNIGGANIKTFARWNYNGYDRGNAYHLFYGGLIRTTGDNNYGQLGDGTNEDLFYGEWDVKGYNFNEMICWNSVVSAIDGDNNVWAWGSGFGNQPEIIISAEDFVSTY